jgi:Protein of unknown function (DUF4089)
MKRTPRKRPASPSLSRKRGGKSTRRTSTKHDPLDAIIDAAARSLELKIDKAWRPAIHAHLQVTLRHGASVAAFALPDDAEPAPVFEP